MRLIDLLYKVDEGTTVWIAEDPSISDGVYFGFAKDITLHTAADYEVLEIYPEHYPAIHNFCGITIIVKKREERT